MNLKIGIVGLGIMGMGIANNFLKKGYPLYVWNRTPSVASDLVSKGAVRCISPAEVASKSDIVFEVTANDKSSRFVWLGRSGILAGANHKKILIECATVSIGWIDELIKLCNQNKFNFFDMAMTGGRIGAETGTLTLLVGGNKLIFKTLEPTLAVIAKKTVYFGAQGQGMRYKLILNFLQAVHIIGYGQAMKIAKANNMNIKKVSNALVEKPGGVVTAVAERTYFQDPYPITFSIDWIIKDLMYAKKFAKRLDVSLLDDVLKKYKKAADHGFANRDWASINRLLE